MKKNIILFLVCLVSLHFFTQPVDASNRLIEKENSEEDFLDIVESHPIFSEYQTKIIDFVSFNEFYIDGVPHRNAVYLLESDETETESHLLFIENGGWALWLLCKGGAIVVCYNMEQGYKCVDGFWDNICLM